MDYEDICERKEILKNKNKKLATRKTYHLC